MTLAIEAKSIFKDYGGITVLKDVSFSVADREVFAVIGPNGAGKSTLFKVITGEVEADTGEVFHRNKDISARTAADRTNQGFGRTFQVARVFPEFSVRENIVVAIEARMRNRRARANSWYDFRPARAVVDEAASLAHSLGLARHQDLDARFLSHGDKKRLEIAVTLALEPRVLLMDEPTAGMSPPDRRETIALLKTLRSERDLTIVIVEHDMDVVFGLADRIMVLSQGERVALGTVAEVRASDMVREVYLGKEIDVA